MLNLNKNRNIRKLQGEFVSYPITIDYPIRLKLWLRKRPWVKVGGEVIFPLQTKVLGTPLEIKQGTVVNGPMTIKGSSNVTIGKYCGIAENLYIISSNHVFSKADIGGKFSPDVDISKGPVYIGNNVWIGDNVTILSGVTVGDGAVIGAGSIVTKDIPPFGIAVGSPAKTIKYRFTPEVIKSLINLGWWHWDKKTLSQNKDFFSNHINNKNIDSMINDLRLESEKEILEINLTDKNSINYLLDGWGTKENDCRWVLHKTAAFILKTKKPKRFKYLTIQGNSFYKPQFISLSINDGPKIKFLLKTDLSRIKLPIRDLKVGINTVRLYLSKNYTPSEISNSNDIRRLYCKFYTFSLI